jgi:hypothetical protein
MTFLKPKANKAFIQSVKFLLCCVFLYASIVKGMEFNHFTSEMKKSPLLEPFNTTVLAVLTLCAEIAAAVLLSFARTEKSGLYLSFFLMTLFSGYLSLLYFGYPNAPCSCGGILGTMPYPVHITFNFLLLALCGLAILAYPKKIDEAADAIPDQE